MGEVDPAYLETLRAAIVTAASRAWADLRDAVFSHAARTIEPIGHNRRNHSFHPIDPQLNVAIFTRDDRTLYLANYAVHPIARLAAHAASADMTGEFVKALTARGHQGLFFQGFCGDINPVSLFDRWEPEEPRYFGEILAKRALDAADRAVTPETVAIRAIERRVRLPLRVLSPAEIDAEARRSLDKDKFSGNERFTAWWHAEALRRETLLRDHPYLEVPVQAIALGDLKILGLPGEIFNSYGTRLREQRAPLFTFGYANGNVGYFPTRDAFADPNDYAAHCAPKFYAIFPFTPEIEDVVLAECGQLLNQIAGS